MTVNPHCSVVVRDRESEDLPVKLHLPPYQSEQLNRRSHRKRHAVGVLSIGDVQRGSTTLYFARQEREIHVLSCHEERRVRQIANERLQLAELLFGKGLSPEPHGIVRLGTGVSQCDRVVPTFVDTFDQNLQFLGATDN